VWVGDKKIRPLHNAEHTAENKMTSDRAAIVVVRPCQDSQTMVLADFGQDVIDYGRKLGFKVIDLYREDATSSKLKEALESSDPKLIVHYGHGREDALLGWNLEALIAVENANWFQGRVVFTTSCDAGEILAQELIRRGASFFLGYEERFLLPPPIVLEDVRAKQAFKECVNSGVMALLDGKRPSEAYQISQETYRKWIVIHTQFELDRAVSHFNFMTAWTTSPNLRKLKEHVTQAYILRISYLKKFLFQELRIEKCPDKQPIEEILKEGNKQIKISVEMFRASSFSRDPEKKYEDIFHDLLAFLDKTRILDKCSTCGGPVEVSYMEDRFTCQKCGGILAD